jgi:hypothetical protein
MAVAVAMARAGVGARLGQEGFVATLQPQAAPHEQIGEHGIIAKPQLLLAQLQSHMPIAEVVGRLEQGQGRRGPHQQQRFRRRLNPHPRERTKARGVGMQPLSWGQRLAAGQLQQQRPAAAALAQATQTVALLSRERQRQHR